MSAEEYVTVKDLKAGNYRTSRGQPQEGIAFLCLEHGVQPFHSFRHTTLHPHGIDLECGCFFRVDQHTGAISKL